MEADAIRLTCWPVPGVSVNVDGDAVTPVGRPERVTCTEPLNPLAATVVSVTDCAEPPAVKVALDGLTCREKSGIGAVPPLLILRDNETVWVSGPEVPVNTTVPVVAAAEAPAAKLTVCGTPAESVSVAGVAVTPVGKPAREILTVPVKPFAATAATLTNCAVPPAVRPTLVGLTCREKSGAALVLLT